MNRLLTHIRTVYKVTSSRYAEPKRGADMGDAATVEDAFILVRDGRISDIGPMSGLTDAHRHGAEEMVCTGRLVLPGFCDSHTHIVFARPREGEFVDRIRGLSYEEIAKRGGGILNSALRLRETSEEALLLSALARCREILALGTTTVEVKSGYGLTTEDELKMLRVIRTLKSETPLNIRATFLGAHAFPEPWRENREGYMRILLDEMIPKVAEEKLADFIDVFCDRGFFTVEQTERVLEKGAQYGLRAKIHANELAISGGVQVGVKHKALSVDHLECIGDEEIQALKQGTTIPTLLPGTSYFLGIEYAPARKLMEAGLPVALASDYNPGSSPSGSMPFVMSLGCTRMKMQPEEALCACTQNGAAALGMAAEAGSLAPGKRADLIVTHPLDNLAQIPYFFSRNPVWKVMAGGQWVV